MAHPINIAAIDAGSNAIRILIAHADSRQLIHALETERYPVRLGHHAFTHRRFEPRTMAAAVAAFRHFRRLMDRYHVRKLRAVATSASREARNSKQLMARIRRATGISVEVIEGREEARLVRTAVLGALGGRIAPRLIVDLGGGSLEVNLMRDAEVEQSVALPIGTVRLMEHFRIRGAITQTEEEVLRRHVLSVLDSRMGRRPDLNGALAAGCGGNAEALAVLAPGAPLRGVPTLSFRALRDRLRQILLLDVPGRMRVYDVRKDRAEVMGIAAVVFHTLADALNLREMLVPGVGVREGVLREIVAAHFGTAAPEEAPGDEEAAVDAARQFATRFAGNGAARHAEQVRRLAVSLFQQLSAVHGLPRGALPLLELGAVLHDVGQGISRKQHYKHGEYIVRNCEIPGLAGRRRQLAACLVRYHSQSDPDEDHKLYASFDPAHRKQIRALSALLRIADGFDCEHRQAVHTVHAVRKGKKVFFRARLKRGDSLALAGARRKAALFEQEFGLKPVFSRLLR